MKYIYSLSHKPETREVVRTNYKKTIKCSIISGQHKKNLELTFLIFLISLYCQATKTVDFQ